MPRSSGGGSHSGGYSSSSSSSSRSYSSGGGSHSGGYRSSSSSFSSSSSRSSGYSGSYSSGRSYSRNVPAARVSKTDFSGARKYVYYKDNKPEYYYSDYETFKENKRRKLTFWIPFIIILTIVIVFALQPSALTMDYDTDVFIADTLGVIEDEDSLFDALEDFRDETGITPCIITISNEDWSEYYDSLYSFTFDMYVNEFEDEKHWLIVYSEPENPDPAFNDWCWEGVQGDDTVYILTYEASDDFGISLQKYLTNKKYSVGEAFTKAFNELTPTMMPNAMIDSSAVLGALVVMAVVLWIAIKRTRIFEKTPKRPATMPAKAVAVKPSAVEVTCEYCDGVYLSDLFNCPHCGAGRQAIK